MKRTFIILLLLIQLGIAQQLPINRTFIGQSRYQSIMNEAVAKNWRALPIGDRMAKIARKLEGVPYKSYTLEIDDHVESPSVNFNGLDCWTFFETVLCMARILEIPKERYNEHDLLREIQWTRYREGTCSGSYVERIHYLVEWYQENHARGNVVDITKEFPVKKMPNICQEMSKLWKSYRYLKHNPKHRTWMAKDERRLTKLPVYMIPKDKVSSIESRIQNGDIIGIATKHNGSYCSHVGLAVKDSKGRTRLMHASTTHKKVVIDDTISKYLYKFKKHGGIIVARPIARSNMVREKSIYQRNLKRWETR